jgi:hypothetical protein
LEDEGEDEDEDSQNVQIVVPPSDLEQELAIARETMLQTQADKRREAMERAAEAAALASAAIANTENEDDVDDDDPLDKFMEDIAKEVKSFRGHTATIVSTKSNANNTKAITTTKQEQPSNNNTKESVIKVVTKTVKTEVREL